ncbi:unnamed protein product [Lactuca saligna]|uniref:Uncharacterized protein n=1 Tax=Lactuca saligna TaxID=75948 RepID=A0AA35ZT06_LACSI|nr:unnamed protein product [Lactuca saligna]
MESAYDSFGANTNMESEHDTRTITTTPEAIQEDEELEVLDNDVFLTGSSSDEGNKGQRRKTIKAIRRAHANENVQVQNRNPDTTIIVDVESEPNPDVDTRIFRRVYACLGDLKKGFVPGKQDFPGHNTTTCKGQRLNVGNDGGKAREKDNGKTKWKEKGKTKGEKRKGKGTTGIGIWLSFGFLFM